MSQLQPGDLVFWDGHVGIYVGGGSVLHAPHTGTVVQITPHLARRHRRRPPRLIRPHRRRASTGTDNVPGDAVQDGPVRLTAFSHGAGCACKLSPADLRTVLGLVRGSATRRATRTCSSASTPSDDAAVYRLRDDLAVVVTTDFFTPIVDDPYDWGRIAATNALSDVYAMGGAPLLALNLVAWPREGLPFELLARVLDGGGDVVRAAGALVGGGHSIDDAEPKFGLAVVGTVDPDARAHQPRRATRATCSCSRSRSGSA